jgi:tRNA pseudouridine55 synthase
MVELFGFINLNKPAGFTSHDCVAKLRRLLHTKKIGHGGTLDPAATGVLPIAIGKATRLLQFLPETKAYRAIIRLGVATTTDDLEGEIISTQSAEKIDRESIIASLSKFTGTIEQVPPMYSAIKRDGQKLYELARKGIKIDLPSRQVKIDKIELININIHDFTELEIEIICSPGTYIRSIARDLGNLLGVGGSLAKLIRTKSCGMELNNSLTFEAIETKIINSTLELIPPQLVLSHLTSLILNPEDVKYWCQGRKISLTNVDSINDLDYGAIYSPNNEFLGIAILTNRDKNIELKPKIVCVNP